MKYPKLKNTVLCQILLYLPGFCFLLGLVALALIPGTWKNSFLAVICAFILPGAFSIWYLIHNFVLLFSSDMLFFSIRQWKKNRTEYRTLCNGKGREKVSKNILRRCSHWGKRFDINNPARIEVFYRHSGMLTAFWSVIEKRVAVCTADTLSEEQYRFLTGQARWVLSAVPDGKPRFKTKSERKAPRAKAFAVLILADSVDEKVRALALQPLEKTDTSCILPCVIDSSNGYYYTNCTAEVYEPGMTPCPVKNFASDMIQRLVFARHLPKENADTQPAPDFDTDVEMSLWEYCRAFRNEVGKANESAEKERIKAYNRMYDGEVLIGDGFIRYKRENKLAEFIFIGQEDDEKLVTLIPDDVWYYKKEDVPDAFLTRLNRRKMKKGEVEQVEKYMKAILIAEGYRTAEDSEG